jgi:hypothetical protein
MIDKKIIIPFATLVMVALRKVWLVKLHLLLAIYNWAI